MGLETVSKLPTLPISNDSYLMEGFLNKERILTHNFDERKVTLHKEKVNEATTALCPEYELNYALFN
jgi:hypothetical protein